MSAHVLLNLLNEWGIGLLFKCCLKIENDVMI